MISTVMRMLRMTEMSLGWHQIGCSRCVDQRWRTTCHQNSLRTRHVELPAVSWSHSWLQERRSNLHSVKRRSTEWRYEWQLSNQEEQT